MQTQSTSQKQMVMMKVKSLLKDILIYNKEDAEVLDRYSTNIDFYKRSVEKDSKRFKQNREERKKSIDTIYEGLDMLAEQDMLQTEKFNLSFSYINDIYKRQERIVKSIETLAAYIEKEL